MPAISFDYYESGKLKQYVPDFQVVRHQKKQIIDVKSQKTLCSDLYEAGDFRRRDKIRGKEKAKFKYNRNDISVIHVFDPQTREYIGVPAINQSYTQNLSLAQHKIIHRYGLNHGFIQGGTNVDVVALALAKQEIQNIVNEAIKKTKAAKTSKQVIKYLT